VQASVGLTIDSNPPGATILLNNKALGQTPWLVSVPRSDALTRFVLVLDGYSDQVLLIRPNKPNAYKASLQQAASP
jgi:hypothetical protein